MTNGRTKMTVQKKVRRLVLVGAAAAAVAAPTAGAGLTPGTYIQIDGKLVNPAHLSEYEAQAGVPVGAHLVQIGGRLIRPDRLSAYQAHAGDLKASQSSSHDDGIGWTTTGIGIGVFASLLVLAGTFGALWRRGRLSTV
jgi:hypothetical protein